VNYRKTILAAVEDVDTAINRYRAALQQLHSLEDALAESQQGVDLATSSLITATWTTFLRRLKMRTGAMILILSIAFTLPAFAQPQCEPRGQCAKNWWKGDKCACYNSRRRSQELGIVQPRQVP
jgi:hypothetical protein